MVDSNLGLNDKQKKQLVSIRDWVLEAAIEELEAPIFSDYDMGRRRKVFGLLNDIVKLAKSIKDLAKDSPDVVYVLPSFDEHYEAKKSFL